MWPWTLLSTHVLVTVPEGVVTVLVATVTVCVGLEAVDVTVTAGTGNFEVQ